MCGQLILFPSFFPQLMKTSPVSSCFIFFLLHRGEYSQGLAVLEFKESCSSVTGTLRSWGLIEAVMSLGRGWLMGE